MVWLLLSAAACAKPAPRELNFRLGEVVAGGDTPFGVIALDRSGDGLPDLAVSSADAGTVTLLRAATAGEFAPAWSVGVQPVARGLAAGDLDRDGRPDIAVASAKSSRVSLLFADGTGGVRVATEEAGMAPFDVAIADLDGDGMLDVAVANETNGGPTLKGDVTVLYGDGAGGFPRRRTLPAGTFPAHLAVADLDGDGRLDLAVVNWGSSDVSVFRTGPTGELAPAGTVALGGGPAYGLTAADLDGDGAPDLAAVEAMGVVRVLRNDGRGNLSAGATLPVGAGARDVQAADLDGDGRPDLVTADTLDGSVSILRNLGGGRFAPRQVIAVGSRPRTVAVADLDADGLCDLAVTEGGAGKVAVLLATRP
jgi:hypothetical protein